MVLCEIYEAKPQSQALKELVTATLKQKGFLMSYRILAVDDDVSILRLIKNILSMSGYEVVTMNSIEEINLCDFLGYDLILLDILMPINGLDICKQIRNEVSSPILFITAKDMEDDLVEGLSVGADDYITKPFTVKEFLARVKMHLRREERQRSIKKVLSFGKLSIHQDLNQVLFGEEKIPFTKREFSIIRLLSENPNKIFSIEELYERIYPNSSDTQFRSITEYIYQIRNKCKPFQINPIETLWGGGYRWNIK